MCTLILVLACLACASHGHEAQNLEDGSQPRELRALGKLLLATDPISGWQVSGAQLGHKNVQASLATHDRSTGPAMDFNLNNKLIPNPLQPVGNFVLVKLTGWQEQTSGGLYMSSGESKEQMPPDGVVVAAGPGKINPQTGDIMPCPCKEGDVIVLTGDVGETLDYEGAKHILLDADFVPAVFEGGEKTIASVRPLYDRIMFQIPESQKETASGIMIAGSGLGADFNGGEVAAVGTGRLSIAGTMMVPEIKVGETVVCEPDVGDEAEVEGKTFKFVFEQDCLATW